MGERRSQSVTREMFWSPTSVADPHAVGLYDSDDDLIAMVVDYIGPALEHEAVVVVMRAEQLAALERALIAAGSDVDAARRDGRFVTLDATQMLTTFMVEDMPDRDRFRAAVGGVLTAATRTARAVRVFGEMVGVLWERGNVGAALALEGLWAEFARTQSLTLLCGYPASAVREHEDDVLASLCQTHSLVLPHTTLLAFEPGAPRQLDPLELRKAAAFTMSPSELRHAAWVVTTSVQLLHENWRQLREREVQELLDSAAASAATIETFASAIDPTST